MKPCVIFDLDGTLCDTATDLLAAANTALAGMGHDVALDAADPEARAIALRGGKAMLRLGLARIGREDEAEVDRGYRPLLDAYDGAVCVHTTFYPGAWDAVRRLRDAGYAVGVCTNKPEALAVKLMAALGAAEAFDSLVGADTLPTRKPDPAPLSAAIERAGGDPARALLVGDTVTDRDTARAAGVPFVLYGPAAATDAPQGDVRLEDYAALDLLVARLIGRP